jgi:integrase
MSGGAIIVRPTALAIAPADALDEAAAGFAAASKSDATRRAYAGDWRDFMGWCVDGGVDSLPASGRTVGRYLTHLASLGRSVSTIDRRAAAIAAVHRAAGHTAPTALEEVRMILAGIRNTLGRRPAKKQALTADLVAKVLKRIRGTDLASVSDRALILVCFGAALRRSELVALDVADLERHRRGLLVRIAKSKTDQQGQGRTVAILDGKLKIPAAVAA